MNPRIQALAAALAILMAVLTGAFGQAADGKAILLNVSKGQVPADTGQDDKTHPEIVSDQKELGEKALKVKFAVGDSFGGRTGGNSNWKRFARFRVDAVNPGQTPVNLALTVVHARSTSYQTRVVVPIRLKPGKNEVQLGIDEMANVNGSSPDLANVVRWYILDVENKGPLAYFGDIYLEGAESTPVSGAGPSGAQPLVGYKVKGKVGTLDVDLTVTPFVAAAAAAQGGAAPAQGSVVRSDPARLARLRAAKMPKIDRPISFDTPEADAILSALEVFPPDNPWNLDISDWPLHANSKNIIASIGADKPFRYNPDMGFVLVPPDQPKVNLKLVEYPGESDKGPFPVPDNVPIEGWPVHYTRGNPARKLTLEDVQRNVLKEQGDRHALIVDPVNRMLHEFFVMRRTDGGWEAAQASTFDLKSNRMRTEGWTSADAAGLPIFPAVVRYDELKRGLVEHAMRVTVRRTRRAYVYPARHYASRLTDENLPRMGERIRLKRDFDVSSFSPEVQAILKGLKKYGMFVADNGIDWAISVAPDPRIPVLHDDLRKIKGSAFEVVQPPPGYQPPPTD
jgi:hypothetical protein